MNPVYTGNMAIVCIKKPWGKDMMLTSFPLIFPSRNYDQELISSQVQFL